MNFTPYDYQQKIKDEVVKKNEVLELVDMGLGKTAPTLQAIETLFYQCMICRVLIVAPLRVAKHVWPAEIEKWGFNLSYASVLGTQKARLKALAQETQLHIINVDNIKWLVEHQIKQKCWPWDMVVIDESSGFKNWSSLRFKAMKKVLKRVDRMVLLTGTPTPNSLLELWSQVYLLDSGKRLGTAVTRYREKYFNSDYMGYNWTIKPGAEVEIYKLIEDLTITMKSEDYITLPECIHIDVPVTLGKAQLKLLKKLEKQFFLELENVDIEACNSAVLAGKLLQGASGAVYDTEKNYHEIHDKKLEALKELLEEAAGENVIVVYNLISDRERILKWFPHAVNIKEEGAIDAWNRSEIPLMICNPKSAGHGLNLQSGGNIIIWFSLTWSLEFWLQMNKRIHRTGQLKPVRIYRIIAEQTIDRRVLGVLEGKQKTQDALIDYLKEKQ